MCGETYCKTCKEYVDDVHQSFTKQIDVEDSFKNAKKTQYIFFDLNAHKTVTKNTKMAISQGQISSA